MSSYLNIYLVPKQENKEKESKPLLLTSYSRNSNIYQVYYENLHPVYIGTEETQYSELTSEDALSVVEEVKENIKTVTERLHNKVKAYKKLTNLNQEAIDSFIDDYSTTKEYIKELKETLNFVQFIANIVSETKNGYTDFEKVLMNID